MKFSINEITKKAEEIMKGSLVEGKDVFLHIGSPNEKPFRTNVQIWVEDTNSIVENVLSGRSMNQYWNKNMDFWLQISWILFPQLSSLYGT